MSHSKAAVLAVLEIRVWDPTKTDKKASQELATQQHVKDRRMCRVRKTIVPVTEAFKELRSLAGVIRTFHYNNTHQWIHAGPRILAMTNYNNYKDKMAELITRFDALAVVVANSIEDMKSKAKDVLGDLFDEKDYPNANDIVSSFSVAVGYQPLPVSEKLMDLGYYFGDEAEELATILEMRIKNQFIGSQIGLWDDMHNKLTKLYLRLNEETKKQEMMVPAKVTPAFVEGLKTYCETIPKVAVFDDNLLSVVCAQILETLDMDMDDLQDMPTRNSVKQQIKSYLDIAQTRKLDLKMETSEAGGVVEATASLEM